MDHQTSASSQLIVPMLDLSTQHASLLPQMTRVFEEIVRSGQFILGSHVERFETNLAAYCESPHAIGVSSGTDALLVSLMAMGIGHGDEVITTPFTFYATAGSIVRVGARPVFVDINPCTFNLDPLQVASAITSRTRAIIPVHLYGQAVDMTPIVEVARCHGVRIIEDAAQAIGAMDSGRRVGSIGDIGCYSFYPTKNLAALGDAGACTANAPYLVQMLRALRVHGAISKYHHAYVGGNFRLDAMQAAMLNLKLPCLDTWAESRRAAAGRYHDLLRSLPVTLPTETPGKYHVYNQYTIRVGDGRRDALREYLRNRGIGHEVYYPTPLHMQPCFECLGGREGQFPHAELASKEVLSLPIYPEIPDQHLEAVSLAIREFFK
jgi:dTDP-4-amino-4,6-dideoxygalactose transaminase